MSHYSMLLINHDMVGHIEKDPKEFWRHAWHAINNAASVAQPFGLGSAYPVATAICQDMTGSLRLVLTDGRSVETLAVWPADISPSEEHAQELILREAAQKLGYRLTKIPEPKSTPIEKIPTKKEVKKRVTKTRPKTKKETKEKAASKNTAKTRT